MESGTGALQPGGDARQARDRRGEGEAGLAADGVGDGRDRPPGRSLGQPLAEAIPALGHARRHRMVGHGPGTGEVPIDALPDPPEAIVDPTGLDDLLGVSVNEFRPTPHGLGLCSADAP